MSSNITTYYLAMGQTDTPPTNQFSISSHNVLTNHPEEVRALPETRIAENPKYGQTGITENFYVYVYRTKRTLRALSRDTGLKTDLGKIEKIQSISTKNNYILSFDDTNTLHITDLEKNETFSIQSPTVSFSNLCWSRYDTSFAAIGSDKNVYLWNYHALLENFESKCISLEDSNATQIPLENQPIHIFFDSCSDLLIVDSANNIFSVEDGISVQDIKLENAENLQPISSIFHHAGFYIAATCNNSKFLIFSESQEDPSGPFRLVQSIEIQCDDADDSPFQLTFLPDFENPLLIITRETEPYFRIFYFSSDIGGFTFHEIFKAQSEIIYHSAHSSSEEKNIVDLFCHLNGSPKHKLILYTYEAHYEDFGPFIPYNISEKPLEIPQQPKESSPESDTSTHDNSTNLENQESAESETEETVFDTKQKSESRKLPHSKSESRGTATTTKQKKSEPKEPKEPKETKESKEPKQPKQSKTPVKQKSTKPKEKNASVRSSSDKKPQQTNNQPPAAAVSPAPSKNLLKDMESMVRSHVTQLYKKLAVEQAAREKQMISDLEKSLLNFVRVQTQAFLNEKLKATVKEFTQNMQFSLRKQIEDDNLVRVLRLELFDHFTTVLGPAVEQTFRRMFKQIIESFEVGIAKQFKSMQEASSSTTAMQGVVDQLSSVCDYLVEETSKPLNFSFPNSPTVAAVPVPVEPTPSQILLKKLENCEFTEAFEDALNDDSFDLLGLLLSKLEGSEDWHGSVSPDLLKQIILRISVGPAEQLDKLLLWIKNILNHIHSVTTNDNKCFQQLKSNLNSFDVSNDAQLQSQISSILALAEVKLLPALRIIQQPQMPKGFPVHPSVQQFHPNSGAPFPQGRQQFIFPQPNSQPPTANPQSSQFPQQPNTQQPMFHPQASQFPQQAPPHVPFSFSQTPNFPRQFASQPNEESSAPQGTAQPQRPAQQSNPAVQQVQNQQSTTPQTGFSQQQFFQRPAFVQQPVAFSPPTPQAQAQAQGQGQGQGQGNNPNNTNLTSSSDGTSNQKQQPLSAQPPANNPIFTFMQRNPMAFPIHGQHPLGGQTPSPNFFQRVPHPNAPQMPPPQQMNNFQQQN